MMNKFGISTVAFLVFCASLFAEEGDVTREYTASESHFRFKNSPHKDPSAMLKENVMDALTSTIQRHFPKNKTLLKGLETGNVEYEQILDTKIVIARYDEYVFEFRYTANPSKFHMTPVTYRYYKNVTKDKKQTELNTTN